MASNKNELMHPHLAQPCCGQYSNCTKGADSNCVPRLRHEIERLTKNQKKPRLTIKKVDGTQECIIPHNMRISDIVAATDIEPDEGLVMRFGRVDLSDAEVAELEELTVGVAPGED